MKYDKNQLINNYMDEIIERLEEETGYTSTIKNGELFR